MTPDIQKYMDCMRSRYGLSLPDFESCVSVFGGVGISQSDLALIADVVLGKYGKEDIFLYELETTDVAFAPLKIEINKESFRALKGTEISHFDLLAVPESRQWAMAFTTDLEAILYGDSELVELVRSSVER